MQRLSDSGSLCVMIESRNIFLNKGRKGCYCMLFPRRIDEDLVFLGGIDRRLELFENMFELPKGVTYNSYLYLDEKTCIVDSVDKAVSESFFSSLCSTLRERTLDYLVVNHAEPDHCATICRVLELFPEAKLVTSKKCLDLLKQFYRGFDFGEERIVLVDEGDTLALGKHKLTFYTAANVHWPEVTVCFDETTGTLFSADAFGSFGAFDGYLFADEVDYRCDWLDESRRYYTNIVGRQGAAVQKLLKKAAGLDIRRIFPLHGLLFRTPEHIELIMEKYQRWSSYTAEEAGLVLIYGSMYENSQQLADNFAMLLAEHHAGKIHVYDVSKTNISYLIADCFRYSNALFICNNYNTELYPKMDAFLRELTMLNWDKHNVTLMGSMSWGGRGIKIAEEILSKGRNLQFVKSGFMIKSSLADEQMDELKEIAAEVANSMRAF